MNNTNNKTNIQYLNLKRDPRTGRYLIKLEDFTKLIPMLPQAFHSSGLNFVATQSGTNPMQVGFTTDSVNLGGVDDIRRVQRARFLLNSLDANARRSSVRAEVLNLLSKVPTELVAEKCTNETLKNITRLCDWTKKLAENYQVVSLLPREHELDIQGHRYLTKSINAIFEALANGIGDFISSPVQVTRTPNVIGFPQSLVRKLTSSVLTPQNGATIRSLLFPRRGRGMLQPTIEEWVEGSTIQNMGMLARSSVVFRQELICLYNSVPETLRDEKLKAFHIPLIEPNAILFFNSSSRLSEKNFIKRDDAVELFKVLYNTYTFQVSDEQRLNSLVALFLDDTAIRGQLDETAPGNYRLQALRIFKNSEIELSESVIWFNERLAASHAAVQANYLTLMEVGYDTEIQEEPDEWPDFELTDLLLSEDLNTRYFGEEVNQNRRDILKADDRVRNYILFLKKMKIRPSNGTAMTEEVSHFLRTIRDDKRHYLAQLYPIILEYLTGFNSERLLMVAFKTVKNAALKIELSGGSADIIDDIIENDDNEEGEFLDDI